MRTAHVLWLLLGAFVLRVVGQALVVFAGVEWLPPMEAWMSGLMPYPQLLASQLIIIALYARIALDVTRGRGWFARPSRRFGTGVLVFGWVYFIVMAARGIVGLHPRAAWLRDPIPIFFHLVLASFLIVFGRWHRAHAP